MVQPLHLQDNLSKIPILQKILESTRAVPEAEREQFAKQLNKEVKDKPHKTQDSKETERNTIRERQKKEEKKKRRNFKFFSKDPEEKIQKDKNDIDSGHRIDITI